MKALYHEFLNQKMVEILEYFNSNGNCFIPNEIKISIKVGGAGCSEKEYDYIWKFLSVERKKDDDSSMVQEGKKVAENG